MIIHKKKIIFIHIPKTGGSAVTGFLKSNVNNTDFRSKVYDFTRFQSYKKGMHDTSLMVLNKIGVKHFKSYYKFCCVRNPYDLMVSSFMWWQQYAIEHQVFKNHTDLISSMNFEQFMSSKYGLHYINEFNFNLENYYSDQRGNIIVDKIIKFENLEQDLRAVCKETGIHIKVPLKKVLQTKRKHYREYYDDKTIEIVSRRFKSTIDYFNYEF